MGYLPLFLDVGGRRCLVVGGGRVAAHKAAGLLAAGAELHVVAEHVGGDIEALAEAARLTLNLRPYQSSDVEAAFLVYACSDDATVQQQVAADARLAGALLGLADCRDGSDFIQGAVLRRGRVMVAVSTAGASPALAVHLRDRLEKVIGDEYGPAADLLGRLRVLVAERVATEQERRKVFSDLLAAGLLEMLAGGRQQEVIELLRAVLWKGFDPAEAGVIGRE